MTNRAQQLNGKFPLAYMGVIPVSPGNFLIFNRPPTPNDSQNFYIGDMWLDNTTHNPPTANDIYMLVSLEGNTATWVSLTGGDVETLTSNTGGAVPPTANNINLLGDGTTIIGVGNPATSTITLSTVGTGVVNTLTGNSGGPVSPSAGNINIVGSGFNVVGNPATHTLTIGAGGTVATQYTANNAGVAVPSGNNLNIFGFPTSILSTTGSGSTITTNLINGTNGQVIIGGGANAAWANITSTGGTVAITNGPNSINLEVGASLISTQVFTTSGTYTPTPGMTFCTIEVVGGGGGGGGVGAAAAAGTWTIGDGGGGGGYARKTVNAATIGVSQPVTVGTGGAAGTAGGGTGGTGGTSFVGAIISASGGTGGIGRNAHIGFPFSSVTVGGIGAGGDFNLQGSYSYAGFVLNAAVNGVTAAGGVSFYGSGSGATTLNTNGSITSGLPGLLYGSGGSGALNLSVNATQAGSAGADGIVIISEFI